MAATRKPWCKCFFVERVPVGIERSVFKEIISNVCSKRFLALKCVGYGAVV